MRAIKYIIYTTIALVSISVQAQNPKKALKNSLIPDKFIVVCDVDLKDTLNPEFMQMMYGQNLNDIVFGGVFSSMVAPYEYNFSNNITDTLSIVEVKNKMGGGRQEIYVVNWETGEDELQQVSMDVHPEEITRYRFIEEWIMDEKDNKFKKNIIAYCPIRKFYREDDVDNENPMYKVPFAILNNKQGQLKPAKADNWSLVTKAVYEVRLEEKYLPYDSITRSLLWKFAGEGYSIMENENMPYMNSLIKRNLALLLYKQALDQNTIAFNLDGYYRKKDEIRNYSGEREEAIETYNEFGDFVMANIKYEFDPSSIQSLIFFEDWYINKSTLQFDKRITAIAPVRFYLKDDAEETERKSIPFLIYTNNEDKERLENLYNKLIINPYNSLIIDHIEMFALLAKQSKSADFKAFCTEKQNDLIAFVLNNYIEPGERFKLFLLSEKYKLGYTIDKITSLPIDNLNQFFGILNACTDTCKDQNEQLGYYMLSKTIGEKIVQLEDNCDNRLKLMRVYLHLKMKDEIAKWQNTDKPWLIECLADYYIKSADENDNKLGLDLIKKVYKDSMNCKIISLYYDMPKELQPKELNVDKYIATQNETELKCFAEFLEQKSISTDSLERIEIMKTVEKIYIKLIDINPVSSYYIGLFNTQTTLGKALDIKLLDKVADAKELLDIISQVFYQISSEETFSANNLPLCKPYIERIVNSDVDEEALWSFAYSMLNWKRWADEEKNKNLSPYLEMLLDKMMKLNPTSYLYLFCKYELDLEQGKNPDLNTLLNNDEFNLDIYAKFFASGYNEYIYTIKEIEPGTYIEVYLTNAIKFYEKLIKLQPAKEEYKREYSEVYYKLTWHYLIKNQYIKANESALMINKIDPTNDNGIIAIIFCNLLNGKESKAYKLSDSYKTKERASKVIYMEFFKYETKNLLEYLKDNIQLTKYLEHLK